MTDKQRKRFRPERTGIGAPLGELEMAVMRIVWMGGDEGCLAADIQQSLERDRPVALTTVLTTLDRLHEKGIVRREREGKAYRFNAAISEQDLDRRIVAGVLDGLIARFPKAVATYFAEAGGEMSNLSELARRLEDLQQEEKDA